MVKARSLLVFSTVSFGLVTLQGGSGGCGGGASVASCTKDGVMVTLLPGDCAPIPSCDTSGYFDAAKWSVAQGPEFPEWLSIQFRAQGAVSAANICAATTAPRGGPDVKAIVEGTAGDYFGKTNLTVHVRTESTMSVDLAIPGAPIVNGRTLVTAAKTTDLSATAQLGSFFVGADVRTGNWSLVSAAAPFTVMSPTAGFGSLVTPADAQLADLVLQLNNETNTGPSDDVFSLPVRIMKAGGAAITARETTSSYRGVPCPGMTMSETPNCDAVILCFTAAGSVLNWPPEASSAGRVFDVSAEPPVPIELIKAGGDHGELVAACPGMATTITFALFDGGVLLDRFDLRIP